jgi:Zn-dependent oligopeptidase
MIFKAVKAAAFVGAFGGLCKVLRSRAFLRRSLATVQSIQQDLRLCSSAEHVSRLGSSVIEKVNRVKEEVAGVPLSNVTFSSTAGALADAENDLIQLRCAFTVFMYIHTNEDVRKACEATGVELETLNICSSADLYARLEVLSNNTELMEALSSEERRLVQHMVKDGASNGFGLSSETSDETPLHEKLNAINAEIAAIALRFNRNVAEDTQVVPASMNVTVSHNFSLGNHFKFI